jgi:hypothetical protein
MRLRSRRTSNDGKRRLWLAGRLGGAHRLARRFASDDGHLRPRGHFALAHQLLTTGRHGLSTHNVGLDHHIVGAADHNEVFDIVTAHDNQLPLPVEIEAHHCVEPGLAAPATGCAGDAPAPENNAIDDPDEEETNNDSDAQQAEIHDPAVAEQIVQKLHPNPPWLASEPNPANRRAVAILSLNGFEGIDQHKSAPTR